MKRLALLVILLAACNRPPEKPAAVQPPAATGNTERGKALAAQYGCNVCHVIPGVDGPAGSLGPSLQGIGGRPTFSNGVVQNTLANMAVYIQEPAKLNPQSSMPPLGVPPADAQDIAAYLMTLR
jgi:cytochrome c